VVFYNFGLGLGVFIVCFFAGEDVDIEAALLLGAERPVNYALCDVPYLNGLLSLFQNGKLVIGELYPVVVIGIYGLLLAVVKVSEPSLTPVYLQCLQAFLHLF
jgi:hypothetical protein